SGLASLGQSGQPRSALAQGPVEQRVMTPADDRHRSGRAESVRTLQARRQPVVKLAAGKQPASRHLGAGNGGLGHQLVELALLEAEIVGGLGQGEQLHEITWLHMTAYFPHLTESE